ncbi:MAG: FKBP-type peptidyl-prolyl cis-trans isomerase [Dysgonamonadaceae bacterium]|jgi:FKBP-type peptidyl-prolyl cis-trans isomerase FklB|nr:FKBP-type peptidyl-prolyl cis-trans isomerase [Dysgonamonadaceae bacterium]
MKKLFYCIAPIVIATVLFFSCTAQTPKASYKNGSLDSLSYAIGVGQSEGFEYELERLGIDSANIKDYVQGILESLKLDKDDKAATARLAGITFGKQLAGIDVKPMTQYFLVGETDTTKLLNATNFHAGFIDGITKKTTWISSFSARNYVDSIRNTYEQNLKSKNLAWLEENKTKEGVITTESGLQYKVVTKRNGKLPVATDRVKVDYEGTLIDGTEFDSSIKRGQPAEFSLSGVIPGWTEGIQLMPVGSEYEFYIPSELGYGERGNSNIPGFATLIFKVTLHEILAPADPAPKK